MNDTEDMTPATSEESLAVPGPSGRPAMHPTYNNMVKKAIVDLKAKGGSSRKAIIKFICSKYCVKKSHGIRATARAVRRMLRSGLVVRCAGGRFKLTPKGRRRRGGRRRKRRGRKGRRRRRRRRSRKGKKRRKRRRTRRRRVTRRRRRRRSPRRRRRRRAARRGRRRRRR